MFQSNKWLLVGMSFLLVFAGTGLISVAQNGPRMGPPMGPAGIPRLQQVVKGLDLTDEQRAQVREILSENRSQMELARRNIIQAQENLDADFPETAEVLGSAHAEAALIRARILKQIKQLLTAEQLNLLEERQQMRKERVEKFRGRFDRGVAL